MCHAWQGAGFIPSPGIHDQVWTYLVGAFLATFILQPVSHYLSLALCPKLYKSIGTKKLEWNSRVVSTAHAVITTAMCLLVFYTEKPVIWVSHGFRMFVTYCTD